MPAAARQIFDRGFRSRWETVFLHARLVDSALHDVRHIDVLFRSDPTNRSHGVRNLLLEACFRLHSTKLEKKYLSTRLTAARAEGDNKKLEVQRLTCRIGALEARLGAFTTMHTGGVAPATKSSARTRRPIARMNEKVDNGPGTSTFTPVERRRVLVVGARSTRSVKASPPRSCPLLLLRELV